VPLTPTRVTRRAAAAAAAAGGGDGSINGGSSSSSSSRGQFYPPTVITGVRPGMSLYSEEVFGPVSGSAGWRSC
jgi:acyl-CoA reductase-like NAD-dependent aldehyde dehydrogenase